jgi:AraC-like DNA-binding protein
MVSRDIASLPAVHALDLGEALRGLGVEPSALYADIIDPSELALPDARISLAVTSKLVARARELTGQPAIGFLLGLQMRVPAHGYLGFAAMTAPTVRHALDLATRFAATRTNALRLQLVEEGSVASLFIDEVMALGDLRDTVLVGLAVGIWRIGEELTGRSLSGAADFAFPPLSYLSDQHGALSVRFDQPRNRLRFDAAYLDLPLVMAHPGASALAQAQLQRAMEEIARPELSGRVREAIVDSSGRFRDLPGVAAALAMSERTLKRKLQAEGASFSDLLDAVRRDHALRSLRDPARSIDEVAEQVGYADTSNFTRAFRRWTGQTPAAYRKSQLGT